METLVTTETSQEIESLMMHDSNITSLSDLDDYAVFSDLARRMERPVREKQSIVYEITKDAGYIHQYCILREERFKDVWDLEHFSAQKDALDDISDIVVARQGLQCIGGGRITYSTPQLPRKLPLESDAFSLVNAMADLRLTQGSYAEVTRIAVLPDFGKEKVIVDLIDRIILQIIAKRCRFLFFISPLTMTRTHRRVVSQLGYALTTRRDVVIPDREEYEGIQMFLSYIDLNPYLVDQDANAGGVSQEDVAEFSFA